MTLNHPFTIREVKRKQMKNHLEFRLERVCENKSKSVELEYNFPPKNGEESCISLIVAITISMALTTPVGVARKPHLRHVHTRQNPQHSKPSSPEPDSSPSWALLLRTICRITIGPRPILRCHERGANFQCTSSPKLGKFFYMHLFKCSE